MFEKFTEKISSVAKGADNLNEILTELGDIINKAPLWQRAVVSAAIVGTASSAPRTFFIADALMNGFLTKVVVETVLALLTAMLEPAIKLFTSAKIRTA